jgi:hypothetical protein
VKIYKVEAVLDGKSEQVHFTSESDADATVGAVDIIMDKAFANKTWAHGAITLTTEQGDVIHSMEAKD